MTLKSLSEIRWAAIVHYTNILWENYNIVINCFNYISENLELKSDTRNELKKKIILRNRMLYRLDKSSVKLQDKSLDLSIAVKFFKLLREYVCTILNNFNEIKIMVILFKVTSKKYSNRRKINYV